MPELPDITAYIEAVALLVGVEELDRVKIRDKPRA